MKRPNRLIQKIKKNVFIIKLEGEIVLEVTH